MNKDELRKQFTKKCNLSWFDNDHLRPHIDYTIWLEEKLLANIKHISFDVDLNLDMLWINDWANWRAIDLDGNMCEYANEPVLDEDSFMWVYNASGSNKHEVVHDFERPVLNWRDTLQKRDV